MKVRWQTKKLREICEAVSTGPFGSMLHKADYVDNGIPLVNPVNLIDERIVINRSMLISESTKDRLSRYVLKEGDIVVARRGEIGRCAVVGSGESGWLCGTGSFFIRPIPQTDSQFLAHLLRSPEYREKLEAASTGTTMQNLSNTTLSELLVLVPPLPEQQRIVDILDEAFEGIATAKANAEKNLQNVRALFESHLQYVFAQRGAGWVEKTLEEVADANCTLSYGIVQPGDEYLNGSAVVRPTDLTTKVIRLSGLKRIDPKLAGGYKRTALLGGELLLCVRGSTGVVSISSAELAGANVTRGIVPIRFDKSRLTTDFGFYLMSSGEVQSQIREKTYGAALMQINIRDLRNITLSFPSLKEQEGIAIKLDALTDETQRLGTLYEQKLASLDELKKSLLHQAFSGAL